MPASRFAFLLLLVFLARAHAATIDENTYYFVTSDHTGAQTQIDKNHTSLWTFSPSTDFVFGGGLFVMKDGGNAVIENIVLTVKNDDTIPYENSVTLTPADFTQQYNQVQFLFPAPPGISITSGHTWTISLTSNAEDHQSTAYFIKGFDQSAFYKGANTSTTPLDVTTTYGGDIYNPAPEPASWLLMAGGIALAGFLQFRRNRLKVSN